MKFFLCLMISCLISVSYQYGQKPRPETEWDDEPEAEWHPAPRPEKQCKNIPKAYDIEFTPAVEVDTRFELDVACDSNSKLKQILEAATGTIKFTCNGIYYYQGEGTYDGVLNSKRTEKLNLINYTSTLTFNNGNVDLLECGTITGGKCSGDTLWGIGIYEANDQNGCCGNGVTAVNALFREIEIRGKCASKCTLGSDSWALAEPVNNYGLADRRNIAAETN